MSDDSVAKLPSRKQAASSGGAQSDAEISQIEERRLQKQREREQLKEQMEEMRVQQMRDQLEKMRSGNRAKSAPAPTPDDTETDDPNAGLANAQTEQTERIKVAGPAKLRTRHVAAFVSFLLVVILPTVFAAFYLWSRAEDRYASVAGFSVRTEEVSSAFELLGGMAELSGSSSSDTDILYSFIQSPELVATVDDQVDLRKIWSRPGWNWLDPADDPIFAFHPPGTIEDLTEYWGRMVNVYSDGGTGIIDLEVQAFTPEDAQRIARIVYDESTRMINRLTAIARDDATRYAREELTEAEERLKSARAELTLFRNRTQIVDPEASMQSQMGVLSSLQSQLAQTQVELDILRGSVSENDPRITQTERRVDVIERRIAEERNKLGFGTGDGAATSESGAFADLVGEYERLSVEREIAEQTYTAAQAAYDTAIAEARRQSRYLAAHVQPTLPESPIYPRRSQTLALVALFAFLGWTLLVLIGYSLRDRR